MNIRNRRSKQTAEVHTSALNDIMFFLMLFFLLASAVANPQVVKLLLPSSSAGEQSVARRTVTVSITDDLRYYLEKQEIPFDRLNADLEVQAQTGDELTVMLYADSNVPFQEVIAVMDIAHKLRMQIFVATQPIKN